jgi:hypothetical protein
VLNEVSSSAFVSICSLPTADFFSGMFSFSFIILNHILFSVWLKDFWPG